MGPTPTCSGAGAGLARMTSLGLRVPPGFTITTEVCRVAMANGAVPDELWPEVKAAVERLEQASGRSFGAGPAPSCCRFAPAPRSPCRG